MRYIYLLPEGLLCFHFFLNFLPQDIVLGPIDFLVLLFTVPFHFVLYLWFDNFFIVCSYSLSFGFLCIYFMFSICGYPVFKVC